ncbi:MAG: flagellin [Myxococcota bacterium]
MLSFRTDIALMRATSILQRAVRESPDQVRKLSTGNRLSSVAEDAAGSGVASQLKARRFSLRMAMHNSENGISLISVAESGLQEVSGNLKRMRELAVYSASDTLDDDERVYLDDEFVARADEITRVASMTEWNGVSLLDTDGQIYEVQVGIDGTANSRINIYLSDLRANGPNMGVDAGSIDVLTAANARGAIGAVDQAIDFVNSLRSGLGATQNRITGGYRLADRMRLNAAEAESRIRDVDVMFESAQFAKSTMTQDSAMALVMQARQMSRTALQLLS